MKRGQVFWFGLVGLLFTLVLISMFAPAIEQIFIETLDANQLPSVVRNVAGLTLPLLYFIGIFAFITLIAPGKTT